MFTLENTYNDIVNSEVAESFRMLIGTMMFSNDTILSVIPESSYELTWREIAETVQTPWRMPFPAQEMVDAANLSLELYDKSRWEIRSLWENGTEPIFNNTKNDVCLFTPVMDQGVRPAVILCPGGAYTTLAMVSEGFGMAKEFTARGFRPYILRYRRLPNQFPCQQEDLTLALLHLKANAERDGIDAENITIAGFSAGGHLCASTVTMIWEMKDLVLKELGDSILVERYRNIDPMPKKMVLGYPVTGTDLTLMTQLCPDADHMDRFDSYKHLSARLPITYAFACEDDPLVPCEHTHRFGEAMKAAGMKGMYHLYPAGGHGIAAGYGTPAEGWMEEMSAFMSEADV
jgi:acetyl esterase/lipase